MGEAKKMDKSFSGVLGGSPTVKIWEFLLIGRNFEYNISQIAEGSGITRPTCYSELKKFEEKNIVIEGKKYKGKQLYKINKKSAIVKAMLKSFQTILYKAE